jgi:hypothetical protein
MRRSLAPSSIKRPKVAVDEDEDGDGDGGTQGEAKRGAAPLHSARGGCGWIGSAGGHSGGGGSGSTQASATSSTAVALRMPQYKARAPLWGMGREMLQGSMRDVARRARRRMRRCVAPARHACLRALVVHGEGRLAAPVRWTPSHVVRPLRPAARAARRAARSLRPPARRRPQCPLPGAQLRGTKASLGMRRGYNCSGSDLLAALNRKVFLTQAGADAASAGTAQEGAPVGDLVLYDPEADGAHQGRLEALRTATAAAEAAAARLAAAEAAAAAAEAAAAGDEAAGGDADGAAAAGTAGADEGAGGGSAGCAAARAPAGDVAALQAAVAEARAAALQAHKAAADAARDAGPPRCKVFAEPFLVEKLRAHQRHGVCFIFTRLSGVEKQGVCGGVLADGMGLGKTFQTVGLGGWMAILIKTCASFRLPCGMQMLTACGGHAAWSKTNVSHPLTTARPVRRRWPACGAS